MIFQGGIGGVIANPTGGNLGTPSFAQRFFTVTSAELDISQKIVKAMGQNVGPDDAFPSDREYKGKCSFLQISPEVFAALMFGDTVATGYHAVQVSEAHTVPGTPFQITIAPPSSGTFLTDLSVQYATNASGFSAADNLIGVPSGPTVGQYSVNNGTGVYTFASADTGANVVITYSYTVTTGRKVLNANRVQGYGPYFEMWLPLNYQGVNTLRILRARCSSMGFKLKRDGYMESPFDFECFPDASGNFFEFGVANAG